MPYSEETNLVILHSMFQMSKLVTTIREGENELVRKAAHNVLAHFNDAVERLVMQDVIDARKVINN